MFSLLLNLKIRYFSKTQTEENRKYTKKIKMVLILQAIYYSGLLTFLWGVLQPAILLWTSTELRNAGILVIFDYFISPCVKMFNPTTETSQHSKVG